jgi:hypothetical protein
LALLDARLFGIAWIIKRFLAQIHANRTRFNQPVKVGFIAQEFGSNHFPLTVIRCRYQGL